MSQWKNVGMRERPAILTQGQLSPDFGGKRGPNKAMIGLKVRTLVAGSIWDQIGLQVGDIVEQINGTTIDGFDAYAKLLRIVENETALELRVLRGSDHVTIRTRTILPRTRDAQLVKDERDAAEDAVRSGGASGNAG